ncbi:mitochondrial import protein Pam17 [Crassisporium funariophilum]|nr:mitochondrial import protein Pam17 [Crassisporium funariophilum]
MDACLARGVGLSTRFRASNVVKLQRVLSRAKSTASKATPISANAGAETSATILTWPEYLAIRRSKRKWQTALTIPCAILGFAGGFAYFGTLDTDPMKPIFGIDPFFFYGIATVGCVGAGALIGPTIGSMLWRASHRRVVELIDAKDHEFFHRIAKNRVDANLQSPTNPVPDYYGERIGSLHQYRQWLRDQAKYKRKALLPEE